MLNYIKTEELKFYLSDGGLLCLFYNGTDMGRVSINRMFPFQFADEYISVRPENYSRNDVDNEIGIIRTIKDMSPDQRAILDKELSKRYFMPEILEIENIKEEFGNISFNTVTTAGKRDFIVNDMGSNIRSIGNNRVMITDVYGNRFCIPDLSKIDDKALKVLEIWI